MMSQELQIEEGTAELLSAELSDEKYSFWKDVRNRCSCFDIEICLGLFILITFGWLIVIYCLIKYSIKFAINKKNFLLLSVIAIILDPLFYYIPVLNDERKCIELDKELGITATVLRSIFDLLKIVHIICALHTELHETYENLKKRRDFPENATTILWLLFLVDILANLPLPQVLVIFRIKGTKFLIAMSFCLLQYLLRVIRTYFLFTQATGVTGILAEATWAIVAFNLLLYMQGGHVFGALWYFYAIEKVTTCWKRACITGCNHSSFFCNNSFTDFNFLNGSCSIKTGNSSSFNFGLYNDALESGVVEETNFLKKLLHCLQWGLQNLSAFGQNLHTSTDIWENIFAICMTNFGVVLFVFLIGRMQSDTARSEKIKQKWQAITQWPNFEDISHDVRGHLRKIKREKWQETKPIDVDNLVNDLPEDFGRKIKREIGLKLLVNVNDFENWSQKMLGDLCDCLKPVFFVERTRIIREGDPIDEMIFVLKGKLWTYNSRNTVTTASMLIDRRSRENHLEDGDFCGQELIAWAKNEHLSNLPISTKTIQALTNIEAFVLMADDLKHVWLLSHYDRAALLIQSRWRFRILLRSRQNVKIKPRLRSLLHSLR